MNRRLLLFVLAAAVGVSACNESSLPTGTGKDLLQNPAEAPTLDGSKFGQIMADTTILDPEPARGASVDSTAGSEHIRDDYNRTKYKPRGWEHIKDSFNHSKYKPEGWFHYSGPREVDQSKYLPSGAKHIRSGSNETRYRVITP